MTERYRAQKNESGAGIAASTWQVMDGDTGLCLDIPPLTFDGAMYWANMRNNEDAIEKAQAAGFTKPGFDETDADCAAKLMRAADEDLAERYRVALNKIARHSDDRYAREIADDALFAASRAKGDDNAV